MKFNLNGIAAYFSISQHAKYNLQFARNKYICARRAVGMEKSSAGDIQLKSNNDTMRLDRPVDTRQNVEPHFPNK